MPPPSIKFVSYEYDHGPSFGAVVGNDIVDLSDVGPSLRAVLGSGPVGNLEAVVAQRKPTVALDHVVLLQVIPDAARIICVGRNYAEHAKELGNAAPARPNLFMRTPQSLVGHRQSIVCPSASREYDYEGELAVVIGRGGRRIPPERSLSHVAGYTCFLDGSVRDFQKDSFTAGKNFDSSGACGPWLVPVTAVPDPQALMLTSRVNGEVMQRASTGDMIHSVAAIISYISIFTHLETGDVIATGTPAGVGAGRTPPRWLRPGDKVEVEIEKIGILANTVISEPGLTKGMWSYFARRLLIGVPTLFAVIAVCFFLMRLAPGGPFDSQAPVPPEVLENLRARYHLNDPLWQQFATYVGNLLHGDFGPSFKYKDFTVTELIAQGLPVSMENGLAALLLAIVIGLPLGIAAALAQNSGRDYAISGFAMTGIVIPTFVMGQLLILAFGVGLKGTPFQLPAGGWNDGALANRILPVTVLTLPFIAYIARISRASMIETLRSNYIRTARAKGLPFRTVVLRHALKSALTPVVTFLGPAAAFVLTGSMVVETIFQIPGIGRYFVQGALNRDYTLVMGVTIVGAAFVIVANLIVDMVYGLLDPKVRYE